MAHSVAGSSCGIAFAQMQLSPYCNSVNKLNLFYFTVSLIVGMYLEFIL